MSPEDLKSGSWGRASCRRGENQIIPGLALSNPLIQKLMLFESHLPSCPAPAGTSNTDRQRSCPLRQPRAGAVVPDHWSSSHDRELANTHMIWLERAADWWLKYHRESTEFYHQKKGSKLKVSMLRSQKAWAHQLLKDNLLQKGCFLATGLILATVIKPLNEQIRGLFTKSAPLIALFDQFQNPFW